MFIGTLDNIRDTKPPPFRILLHTGSSDISYVVAVGGSLEDIDKDWKWLEDNLVETLGGRGRFPTSKIQLLILGVPLIAFFQNGTAEEAFSLPCCNEFLSLPSKYHHEVVTHIVPVHTTTRGM